MHLTGGIVPPRSTASMGPQLLRCGNRRHPPQAGVSALLQWGRSFYAAEIRVHLAARPQLRGFNGAAAFTLRKCDCVPRRAATVLQLQWGRSFYAAEIWIRDLLHAAACCCFNGAAAFTLRKYDLTDEQRLNLAVASMGPQLLRCGNSVAFHSTTPKKLASMGPQLLRCGNLNGHVDQIVKNTLQWGRSFYAAEIWKDCRLPHGFVQLQWGRSFYAAEICWRPSPSCRNQLLQWGRSFYAAEIEPLWSMHGKSNCFNGAAAFTLRKCGLSYD